MAAFRSGFSVLAGGKQSRLSRFGVLGACSQILDELAKYFRILWLEARVLR